ncbi:hypothetical protein JL722_9282 [Aureococcus anophagefferens]|nr:hypothetical protein JL722_9282 [Aureococcus anophagefferens]
MYRLPVWIPPEPERPKRDHAPPDPAIVAAALETLSRPASPDILKISSRPGTSENAKLAKLAEERRVIELARCRQGWLPLVVQGAFIRNLRNGAFMRMSELAELRFRTRRAKIIQHCWRSHFVRVLAPRMRKLHAASTGLKRALRAKKLRMARTKIRTFLDEIREEEGSPRNAVQHFLHSVRKSQRAIRNFSICWKARRKVCWKLWVKLEHEIREKLASDAMAAHKRAINEHASQRKASAATHAHGRPLGHPLLQRKQQALEILKPLPDVDDVAKRHAAVRKPDGALVSLGTTEVLGMVVLACRRKRRRHIAYAAELREREKVMVIDHDVAQRSCASGKLNPSRDLNQLKEKAKKERRTFSWPALRLYTATNLGDTWHDIIKDLVVRDLHARRQQLANRLKSMIQPEEVERLASMLLDDDPDQTKMQDYMSSSREDLMSFSIDLTLENSSIASGSTAISKATPTSGSGPHHHHGAHPGLTVRVIRRKAEDQEADDRARENKARGDDENVDALLAATDRYRL